MPTARALTVSIHVQLIHEIISTNLQKNCNSRNFKVTSLLNIRLGFHLGSVLEPVTGICISRKGGTGGDGWGHLLGAVHMVVARLGCRELWLAPGGPILTLAA